MRRSALHDSAAATDRELLIIRRLTRYSPSMPEFPDKLGAIAAATAVFGQHGVPFSLVGGLAVGIRSGVPRATLDVDFAVATTVDRSWLIERMVEKGFSLRGEFVHSINFEHESGEPVQLAFDPEFDAMIQRAEVVDLGAFQVPVVTKDDLIAMKRRAAADPGRRRSKALRDQADIALLEGDVPDSDEGW